MNENEIGDIVLGGAMKVHSALGPGLLESAYEICLAHEITKQGLSIKQQVLLPVQYNGLKLDAGYRVDLLVHNDCGTQGRGKIVAYSYGPAFELLEAQPAGLGLLA